MDTGHSWSGRERNNCYLNLGDGRFVDGSAVSGLDFLDDGRAVAATDWDRDGDLDLLFRNRTGPQLRFMRNTSRDSVRDDHFISLKLEGTTVNRDAIGVRVTVRAQGLGWMKELTAGDGYLSQSSRWLHFGLGPVDHIEGITVRWSTNDVQSLPALPVDHHYVLRQGGTPEPLAKRVGVKLDAGSLNPQAFRESSKTVLRMPLPLSPTLRSITNPTGVEAGDASLVVLWASWCPSCLEELAEYTRHGEALRRARLRVIPLNVDEPEDRPNARKMFERLIDKRDLVQANAFRAASDAELGVCRSLVEHIVGKETTSLPLPVSFLIDGRGDVQVLYLGRFSATELAEDARRFGHESSKAHTRSAWPGRWYFRTPRDLAGLSQSLKDSGHHEDAAFYFQRDVTERIKRAQDRKRNSP